VATIQEIIKQCGKDSHRWFPKTADDIGFMTLAMVGEAGEVANVVKKILRGSLFLKDAKTKNDLAMEITDVFIYLMDLCDLLGIDIERAYNMKRMENEQRFGLPAQNGRRS
jgi:NTP pyrophosphatase (non-canonical NTP hydrolase)